MRCVTRIRPLRLAGGVPLLLLLLATGCGSGASTTAPVHVVRVTESDFRIQAPRRVPAGEVRLRVRNRGPDSHELLLVRLDHGRLPLRSDGLTVNEDLLEQRTLGVLEPGEPYSVRELRVRLSPGRYELFCNMAGHYLGGMRADFVVS